jgi:hypothetical protein
MNATKTIESFLQDDRSYHRVYRGYKLVEYSLLIALVILGSSAILPRSHGGAPEMWSASNTRLVLTAGE